MKNKSIIEQIIKNKYADIFDIVLCICLFVMAIYKGSFYKQDILFPNIIVTTIGVGYVLIRLFRELFSKREKVKKKSLLYNLLSIFVIVLPIAYCLPIVFGKYSSLSNSIYEMLRYVNFCVIYFIVKKSDVQNLYIKCLVIISAVLTILGIDQMTFRALEPILNKLSTGYLYQDRYRLSSTVQYANITGNIILVGYIFICMKLKNLIIKYINNRGNMEKTKDIATTKIKSIISVCICTSLLTLQVIAIILTNSRMVILLLCLFNIAISIYYAYKKRKILALIICGIFLFGVVFSENMILNITTGAYVVVYKYILLAVISANLLVCILINSTVRKYLSRLKNKLTDLYKKKRIATACSIGLFAIIVICILTLGKTFRIKVEESNPSDTSVETKKIVGITKDLSGFKEGKNRLEIDIAQNVQDSRYTINILGITNNNKEEVLGTINYFDRTDTKYVKEFRIYGGIKRVVLDIKMEKGDVTFDRVELNDKNQKLSYMFLPEKIISKFKETYTGDNSNKLRYDYFRDSIKIWENSKLFGFGGEAFKYKYQEVQSSPYISTEAHSCILQTLVEAGIIGAVVIIGIIVITIYISFYLVAKCKNEKKIYLFCSILSILTICIFDLALSFGIMIYILAVFIGILSKEYLDASREELVYENSYGKIALLSFAIVCLVPAIYFSMNIYRASLIKVESRAETLTSEEYISDIQVLNKKVLLDKYDTQYRSAVIGKYEEYKKALSSAYYSTGDKTQRAYIKEEIRNSIKNIKENTDILINNEYSDKYILELGAEEYFMNFMNFSNIYKEQFKDNEIAYAFYLGYALKLTDRITQIAPYNTKSKEIAMHIYKYYLEELIRKNDIIQSQSIANICGLLETRIKGL